MVISSCSEKPPKYYHIPPKQYLSDIETHNYTHYDTANGSVGNTYKVKCYYNAKYYDTTRSRLVDFQCPEDALKKGFCILHEDDVSKSKENELDNTLNEKINKLIDVGQEIFWLGYNIPFVSFRGKKIYKPIYFHDAKIKIADFREAIFTEGALVYFVNTSLRRPHLRMRFSTVRFCLTTQHFPERATNRAFSMNGMGITNCG